MDERQLGASAMWTVGHGTLGSAAFAELVHGAGIRAVVYVRRFPGSRRHPQFGGAEMARWLPTAGMEYRWITELGGRRSGSPDSLNVGLRNAQFCGSSDLMVG